ncbi:nitroreductase family protein [Spirillospora sp. NPDC049652]
MRPQLHSKSPLLDFWESTRLSEVDAFPEPAGGAPGAPGTAGGGTVLAGPGDTAQEFRTALAVALGRGCGRRPGTVLAKDGTFVQARSTPSAGALYPFEVLVGLAPGAGATPEGGCHLYEIDADRLSPLATAPPVTLGELAAGAGIATEDGAPPRAVVTFAARPWRSMAKYGRRGYRYTLLDTGHAAVNFALAARDLGLEPTVHLRFHRQWVAHALGLTGTCREPQVVVTIAGTSRPAAGGAVDGATGETGEEPGVRPVWLDRHQARLDPPDDAERRDFEALRDISLAYGPAASPLPGSSGSLYAVRAPGAGGSEVSLPPVPRGGGGHAQAMARRESVKGFLPEPVGLPALARLLDGLDAPLDGDFTEPGVGVGVRLVVRDVTGLPAGAYAYGPDARALLPVGLGEVTETDVLETLQRQAGLRHAAVLVLLHAPLSRVLRELGRAGLAETHFHAAHVAQRLCLNAAGDEDTEPVGVTCVGGFDEAHGARLGRLSHDEEIVYLVALGVPDPNARKTDRDAIAYSHGRTTVSGDEPSGPSGLPGIAPTGREAAA